MVTIDKITELRHALRPSWGTSTWRRNAPISEEEKYTHDPDFWNDQKKPKW